MRRLPVLMLAACCLAMSACQNHAKPTGPALVYVLQVSYADLMMRYADYSNDSAFVKAVYTAQEDYERGRHANFFKLLGQDYSQAAPEGHLSAIFAGVPRFHGKITEQTSNADVLVVLQQECYESMLTTARVIENRFVPNEEPTGLAYLIRRFVVKDTANLGETALATKVMKERGIIEVSVYGHVRPERIRHLILTRGEFGFWDTYENTEIYPSLVLADKALDELVRTGKVNYARDASEAGVMYDEASAGQKDSVKNCLFRLLNPIADQQGMLQPGPAVGMAFGRDTARIDRYLALDAVRASFPGNVKFIWGVKSINPERSVYELYAIKTDPSRSGPVINGDVITDARQGFDVAGSPDITMSMNEVGSARWEQMTAAAAAQSPKRCVAIAMDNRVFSSPRVQNKISGGNTEISGISTINEAIDLAQILRYGSLPAPVVLLGERVDGASAEGQ